MGNDSQVRDEDLQQEIPVTKSQATRIEERAERIERKTTQANVLKVVVVISMLLLAAVVNSLAQIPSTVKENTKEIEATVERLDRYTTAADARMSRHVDQADKHFDQLREDVKEIRAMQVEILKELQK
jgi:hypothetical protein